MLADERNHVSGTRDRRQAGLEHEFCNSRGCLDLSLENIRLQRVLEALLEQVGWLLIRHRLPGLNEHILCC